MYNGVVDVSFIIILYSAFVLRVCKYESMK